MSSRPRTGTANDVSVIGPRVRAARARLHWTRETLAHRCGLSWSAIEQIESGRRSHTRPSTLKALAKALGVTIDYLLGDSNPPRMLSHQVHIYGDDAGFVSGAVPFLLEGIERSEAVLAITQHRNIGILKEQLADAAALVEFVDAQDRYTSPLAALTEFRSFVDSSLEDGAPWIRLIGEPRWAGESETEARKWYEYESFFNLAFRSMPTTVLCLYDERLVHPAIVDKARLTHPQIIEDGELIDSPLYIDPTEFLLRDADISGR